MVTCLHPRSVYVARSNVGDLGNPVVYTGAWSSNGFALAWNKCQSHCAHGDWLLSTFLCLGH